MAALVIINAMVFQERLASNEVAFQPVSAAMRDGRFSRMTLLQIWEHILSIDYYPIFSMARDVVRELSEVEATEVLGVCQDGRRVAGHGRRWTPRPGWQDFQPADLREEAAGRILYEHPRLHSPCGTGSVFGQMAAR